MRLNPVHITARDLPDAWFQCVFELLNKGRKYTVQQGSYEGETRLEFDWVEIHILRPYSEPYDTMLPEIPAHVGIPNPVEQGYIEQYMPYLMTSTIEPGEDYTYGSRLWPYVPAICKRLRETPNTNQAILQVAQPLDFTLNDPPCLRHIDIRVADGALHFFPYFRSWDLWGGFPANLGGLAVLQKYMADEVGVEMGEMIATSKGLHIYGYAEELAKMRTYKQETKEKDGKEAQE